MLPSALPRPIICSMPDDNGDARNDDAVGNRLADMLIQATAGAGGAVLGYYIGDMPGAVVSNVAPVLMQGIVDIWTLRREAGIRNAASAIDYSTTYAEIGAEELFDAIRQSPRLLMLATSALNSAASTDQEWKIKLLAKFVAEGVLAGDDAKIDNSLTFASAAADLDRPHIAVLEFLTGRPVPNHPERIRTLDDEEEAQPRLAFQRIQEALPQYGVSLGPIVSTLDRHNLISSLEVDVGKALTQFNNELNRAARLRRGPALNAPKPGWRVTSFGLEMLRYLRSVHDNRSEE